MNASSSHQLVDPEFAAIANLIYPGRVPSVEECVRALDEGHTMMDFYRESSNGHIIAIQALLSKNGCYQGLASHKSPAQCTAHDIKAVLALLESIQEKFGHACDLMESVCERAGVVSEAMRAMAVRCREEGLIAQTGGAA